VRQSRGFTLIELLVVLAILALAYALVPPLFSDTPSTAEMRSAARQLAAGLRKARNQAVTRRSEARFSLDAGQHSFSVSGDTRSYRLPVALDVRLLGGPQATAGERQESIRFYSDGSSDGGRVLLGSEGRQFEVEVDSLTGHVAILD